MLVSAGCFNDREQLGERLIDQLLLDPTETIRLDDCGGCDSLPGETVWTSAPGGDDWRRTSQPTMPDRPGPQD